MSKSFRMAALVSVQTLVLTYALMMTACTRSEIPPELRKEEGQSIQMNENDGLQVQERVWVAKPDGTQQCGMGQEQDLQNAVEELRAARIEVFSSKKVIEPGVRIQLCGSPTGQMNACEISVADLKKAQELGFSVFVE